MQQIYEGYRGLIFDLDGTLINSMPVHAAAWVQVCREHGFEITPETIYRMGGMNSRDIVAHFRDQGHDTGDLDAFAKRKMQLYREHIDTVQVFPGILGILKGARAAGLKIAIGTGTQRINAEDVLTRLNLMPLIDALVTSETVSNHKPHPETFLHAAGLLGLRPDECLVFEDGPMGIKAALDGGFDCVEARDGALVSEIKRP